MFKIVQKSQKLNISELDFQQKVLPVSEKRSTSDAMLTSVASGLSFSSSREIC